MVELRRAHQRGWDLGYGGDMLNMAVHIARLGCECAFLTAIGTDSFSSRALETWESEGVDCTMIVRNAQRGIGLYAIDTDAAGERSFTYWRGQSAARSLFADPLPAQTRARVRESDALVFSLISLAILPDEGRQGLLDLAGEVADHGGIVAFDGNYRPALWEDAATAARWRDAAIDVATLGLPTLDDEIALEGDASVQDVARTWGGASETVIKLGAEGCQLADGRHVKPPAILDPVDTSGAGDAFGAAYIAARSAGSEPAAAARAGHRLAGWVVMRRGAAPSVDEAAPYASILGGQ